MTNVNQLRGKYFELRDEIDRLTNSGEGSPARLARLTHEMNRIDEELATIKRRALFAPTLSDIVPWAPPQQREPGQERRAVARSSVAV